MDNQIVNISMGILFLLWILGQLIYGLMLVFKKGQIDKHIIYLLEHHKYINTLLGFLLGIAVINMINLLITNYETSQTVNNMLLVIIGWPTATFVVLFLAFCPDPRK